VVIISAFLDLEKNISFSDNLLAKLRLKPTSRSALRPFGPELKAEGLTTGWRRKCPIA
jgi:hypothetical protein